MRPYSPLPHQVIVQNGVTYTAASCAAPTRHTLPAPARSPPTTVHHIQLEWNLDVQRAITNNLTADVAYVGNHGYAGEAHMTDLDQPPIGTGWDTPVRSAHCLATVQALRRIIMSARRNTAMEAAKGLLPQPRSHT